MVEVNLGGYALPLVLSIVLSLIFKTIKFQDRWKAPIAIFCGISLGLVGLAYQGREWTIINIVDFVLYGFMTGAGAVGLYELSRSAIRPRE